jgi:RNA polymerase sigma factor (sigma-70 family)
VSPELRLVRRAADGDEDAYSRWLAELRPALLRYAADRLGGDRAEAEDVVQDSAMRALVALRSGRVPANPRAWMYVIVRNRCHDVRAARRPVTALDEAREVRSPAPDPDEHLSQRRRLDAVVTAIADLPAGQRDALVGATFEGRPYEELAARQATTVPAIKSLIHRARRGLDAAGARAAAVAPWFLAARLRLRGAAAQAGDGVREQLAGVVTGHTGALASVAAVAVTAVPVAVHETRGPAHHERPRAVQVAQAPAAAADRAARAGAAAGAAASAKSDSVGAVRDACASGAPLTGRFTVGALARARDDLGAQEQEYGSCSARISSALLHSRG